MRTIDIIAKKRDGQSLSPEEIDFFVQGFARGEIADYQASAFAMAVYLRGMDEQETTALTLSMARSGTMLDLASVAPKVLDKHSSGGVGDKTTLVVGPLIASLGFPFGKMSGRGLGFSGGTLDKLESIPGYRSDLSTQEFVAQLRSHGLVVSGQTHHLAPADGKLYALRDVTATVSSLPLIASSIMSKKIAAGAQVIVLDVKVGRGAFMKTEHDATALARLMVRIGQGVGRTVGAVISDMNQPLGKAVGNSLEVIEAIETLKGKGPEDFVEHCLTVTAVLIGLATTEKVETISPKLSRALQNGTALAKFSEWIGAQGGDRHVVDRYDMLPGAPIVETAVAPRDGYVARIDAEQVGLTVVDLGGGRIKKDGEIDHAVGVVFACKIGDKVAKGDPLFTLHAGDRDRVAAAITRLNRAIELTDTRVSPPPLIHSIIQ